MLKNDRLIRALLRQPVDQVPMWIMRQAGRYLPEYRQLRTQSKDFIQFCKTPELTVEATLQPIRRFSLDAAIIFSDILMIPAAMGLGLHFLEGEGPVFERPLQNMSDLRKLHSVDVGTDLSFVMEAIQETCHQLDHEIPLIGFAGSPWTVACYMIAGRASKNWHAVKCATYSSPAFVHALLQMLTQVTIDYLNAQVEAGARVLMLFDTWGGILEHTAYAEFSLSYMQKIAAGVHREWDGQTIPLVFFTKNAAPWLQDIANSGCDAVGIDSSIDLSSAQALIGSQVALQGNLDPWALFADESKITAQVKLLLSTINPLGYVFNLGHGVHKDTPVEHVAALVKAVRTYGCVTTKNKESVN